MMQRRGRTPKRNPAAGVGGWATPPKLYASEFDAAARFYAGQVRRYGSISVAEDDYRPHDLTVDEDGGDDR